MACPTSTVAASSLAAKQSGDRNGATEPAAVALPSAGPDEVAVTLQVNGKRVPTTSVRYNGILHDFMMLNPLRETAASTGAVEQAIHVLRKALATS